MPQITPFFDQTTFSYSYVVADDSGHAAVIDAVLDFDPAAVRATTGGADTIIEYIESRRLQLDWILETHVHADHLSAAQYIKAKLGGQVAIGEHVTAVQEIFKGVFNAEACFAADGSQFDRLLKDGDSLSLGSLSIDVMHTPGHTPACVTYLIDDAAFVGDTLFMPDYGSARTDFPGGNAHELYRSIRRILALPASTALYMCHDYGTDTRKTFACETDVASQNATNIHINTTVSEADFVDFREGRDAELAAPRLLYPAVQFNMRAGHFPPAENNGRVYLKLPVRDFAS
jgi:glyoxylase-like metal-dependent hydrolase (beta-lactamase superfamily II)